MIRWLHRAWRQDCWRCRLIRERWSLRWRNFWLHRSRLVPRKYVRRLLDGQACAFKGQIERHEGEVAEVRRLLTDSGAMQWKLCWLGEHPSQRPRFRLVLDIAEPFVHSVFVWGNSQEQIDNVARYVGEAMGAAVSRELRQLNFRRFRDEDDFRSQPSPRAGAGG